ncbi:MAG: putative metal-dependent phosphoesterase TrpH [Halobacteriales archaeon]|jgi:predicted metal-dependent phosphoesterase TrpH
MHVKVLDDEVVTLAKRRGMDAVVYAPHFSRLPEIRERARRFSDDDLLVVPAREVFAGDWRSRKHVLALGLSDPVPDFITLEAAVEEFERQDATVLVPHPTYLSIGLSAIDVHRYRDAIDGIELYNPKFLPWHERRARDVLETVDRQPFASSYAHLSDTVGMAWTEFEDPVDDEAALIDAVENGEVERVVRRNGPRYRRRQLAELGHLVYENTWEKLDRLFLSGTEPTHPRHIAYDGRFEDASVY